MWLHRTALFTVGSTLGLIYAGALVTTTGSGLAVPDWPLSFGQFFPPMVGGVFYEHGHRMVAGAVALLTFALAALVRARESRRWVRRLAGLAALAVIVQALLGGMTVLLGLPTAVSVAHACLAQAFLCLVVTLAVATGPTWNEAGAGTTRAIDEQRIPLRWITAGFVALVYGQLVVGAVMRHIGAGLAIPDFPLAYGRLVPPLDSQPVIVHFLHRLGALAIIGMVGWIAVRVLGRHGHDRRLVRPALVTMWLVVLQVGLGALTIWTRRAIVPTSAHVVVGATVLATALVLALRAHRLLVVEAPADASLVVSKRVTA
jgi:cytochrome c oxidase assembly protein subunit 15